MSQKGEIIVKEEDWKDDTGARFRQREIRLESYVTEVQLLVSDHLDGKDVIGFRRKDIPQIIEALQQVMEDNK